MTYGDIFLYSVAFLRNITFCKKIKGSFFGGVELYTYIHIYSIYVFSFKK